MCFLVSVKRTSLEWLFWLLKCRWRGEIRFSTPPPIVGLLLLASSVIPASGPRFYFRPLARLSSDFYFFALFYLTEINFFFFQLFFSVSISHLESFSLVSGYPPYLHTFRKQWQLFSLYMFRTDHIITRIFCLLY